jgi:hypothetical protein
MSDGSGDLTPENGYVLSAVQALPRLVVGDVVAIGDRRSTTQDFRE